MSEYHVTSLCSKKSKVWDINIVKFVVCVIDVRTPWTYPEFKSVEEEEVEDREIERSLMFVYSRLGRSGTKRKPCSTIH